LARRVYGNGGNRDERDLRLDSPLGGRQRLSSMSTLLSIGEFSRLTHVSVKALRHYDEVGLLRPVNIDDVTGYRQYATAQVPAAHVIRRFRALDMPLEQIRVVLEAPDVAARDRAIVNHLQHMEETLERTQTTVASLRALLEGKAPAVAVEYRSVPATRAVAVREKVSWIDAERWLSSALAELRSVLSRSPEARLGPDAALYSSAFFEAHFGEVVAFVPVANDIAGAVRVELIDIPSADLAVTVHEGKFGDLDQAYGALGTFVAERVLATEGPIREHYLGSAEATDDPMALRTEVCWPIRQIPKEATP
jgi:DNA-binding transcriptional MerR regulator